MDDTIGRLDPHLASDDIVIDGGNSNFRDTMRRATRLRERESNWSTPASRRAYGYQRMQPLSVGRRAVERVQPPTLSIRRTRVTSRGCSRRSPSITMVSVSGFGWETRTSAKSDASPSQRAYASSGLSTSTGLVDNRRRRLTVRWRRYGARTEME